MWVWRLLCLLLSAMRMGTVADTIYLSAVALDSAAPSSSSLFLHKAVVSATRGWYTPPPLVFCKGVKSQCLVVCHSPFSETTAFCCPFQWSATWN